MKFWRVAHFSRSENMRAPIRSCFAIHSRRSRIKLSTTESVIEDSSTSLHLRNKIPTLVAKDATRMGHPVFQIKITDVGRGCPTHTTHTAGLSSAEKLRQTGPGLRRLNLR